MIYKNIKETYYRFFPSERAYKNDFIKLADCEKILDLGCGFGYFISNDPNKIIGIDINSQSIRQCRGKRYKAVIGSVIELPFKSGSFDGVHCAHLIEHFNIFDVYKVITEASRVLKVGGLLIIRTPMLTKYFYDEPSHIRPYPPSNVLDFLNLNKGGQETPLFVKIYEYEFIEIKFKRRVLFQPIFPIAVNPKKYAMRAIFKSLGLLMSKFGIRHPQKGEYAIIAKKIQ